MESPFEHLVAANYVPTEQEVGIISQLLLGPQHELDRMDGAIRDMEHRLSQLRMRRDRLWISVSRHRGMISCARRLPDDVLQEIFIRTLPTSCLPTINVKRAPEVLTHVCRRWRELALSTPHLWSGIHVQKLWRYGDFSQEDMDRKIAAIGKWIARARAVPISISLEYEDDIPSVLSALHKAVPQLQWNGFKVGLITKHLDESLTVVKEDSCSSPFSTAQRLHLDLAKLFSQSDEPKLKEVLTALKLSANRRLRSLTLRNNFDHPSFDMTAFTPCSSLRYLDFGTWRERYYSTAIDMSSLTNLLKQRPNL